MTDDELIEGVARTICKSGRFETGQGTCALICMDQLGSARENCRHVARIHGDLAREIMQPLRDEIARLRRALDSMKWPAWTELKGQSDE